MLFRRLADFTPAHVAMTVSRPLASSTKRGAIRSSPSRPEAITLARPPGGPGSTWITRVSWRVRAPRAAAASNSMASNSERRTCQELV